MSDKLIRILDGEFKNRTGHLDDSNVEPRIAIFADGVWNDIRAEDATYELFIIGTTEHIDHVDSER